MSRKEQQIFAVLADARRRELIEILSRQGMKTATELADALPITRQGISKHLKLLAEVGLVQIQQEGRKKRYSLTPEPLTTTIAWVKHVQTTQAPSTQTYLLDLDTT